MWYSPVAHLWNIGFLISVTCKQTYNNMLRFWDNILTLVLFYVCYFSSLVCHSSMVHESVTLYKGFAPFKHFLQICFCAKISLQKTIIVYFCWKSKVKTIQFVFLGSGPCSLPSLRAVNSIRNLVKSFPEIAVAHFSTK